MDFVYSLCSSSKGNATYIGSAERGVLVDAGLSLRALKQSLAFRGIELTAIKAIFITHEHSDHIRGIKNIGKLLNVPIYGSKETLHGILASGNMPQTADCVEIKRKPAIIEDMTVRCFETPHDTPCSLGYRISFESGKSASICTDLGKMTTEIYENIAGSDLILLESNYDEEMLLCGSYPYFLQQRIRSINGHLSNTDSAEAVKNLYEKGTKGFLLGHLSENNNTPILAYQEVLSGLVDMGLSIERDFSLAVASPRTIGEVVEI